METAVVTALRNAAEHPFGSHLGQREARILIDTLAKLGEIYERAQDVVTAEDDIEDAVIKLKAALDANDASD